MKTLKDPFAPTPEGFHLRVEQTLDGLEEREMTKRKLTASLAFALALVMIMAAAAVAGVSGGYVGWDGIIHYYDDDDATVGPVDRSAFEAREAADETYRKYLQTVPRGECWTITKDGENLTGVNFPNLITDEEVFLSLIEGTGLPVPSIPGGYEMVGATIITDCEETPYEERTLDDGAVLSKYKLKEPVAGEVDNYDYQFWKDHGNVHAIWATIVPASEHLLDDCVMRVNDIQTAEAVEVEGFEYGLYVHDSEFGLSECLLMKDLGDKMLRVDIAAFEDLPKEAVLNLFNPEGNIDLSSNPAPARADSGVDFSQVPKGEHWVAVWTQNELFREASRGDTKVADFAEISRLSTNKNLPVPTVPEGWHVIFIFSMAPIEPEPFEVTDADNGYILSKYHMKEVADGDLEHYRFCLHDEDDTVIFGEVFPASELEVDVMKDDLSLPDFSYAEEIEHPRFTDGRMNPAHRRMDNIEYLFRDGDTYIYVHTDQNVPAETVLSLFPAE